MMRTCKRAIVLCCVAAGLQGVAARAITFQFDAADLFKMAGDPSDGLLQHEQENPHRLWYRDLSGDIVNWGVTYGDSQVARFKASDPNAAYADYQNWVALNIPFQPRITAFNVALRPYDATVEGWGQDITFRNPPADWTSGTPAQAAGFLDATAPPGWRAVLRWDPFAGPLVQWLTIDPLDPFGAFIDPNSSGQLFSISGDFLRDTDMDGVGDTEFAIGEDARLYLGTQTIFANWDAAGLDLQLASRFPQYDSVVGASVTSVPSEPVTAILMAMSCGALAFFRRMFGAS